MRTPDIVPVDIATADIASALDAAIAGGFIILISIALLLHVYHYLSSRR